MSNPKFCSKTNGTCSLARDIAPPGRVKIALDRDPIDGEKIDALLKFLSGKLSDDDFERAQNMLDDAVDDAEEVNPSVSMDSLSVSTRRAIRRAVRRVRLPHLAQDGFAKRFPNAERIKVDNFGAQPRPARLAPPSADFYDRFPNAARLK